MNYKNKFVVFMLLELPILLLFLYICWYVIFIGSRKESISDLPFVLGLILGIFFHGIAFVLYSNKVAPMVNKGSWGLYKFTPRGILKLGYFFIIIGLSWLIFLIYHNHGIKYFFRLIVKSLSR